jgi:diaminopimelate decarboxylase
MMEFSGLREGLRRLRPIFTEMRSRWGTFESFDAGGGLGVDYESEDPSAEEARLRDYAGVIHDETKGLDARLQLEPGRWLVARAGVLIAQVQYVKKTSGRTFVILDTGMNHLIRPALYQAHHRILPLRRHPGPSSRVDVVGPICESADFLAKERELPPVVEGDLVAIGDTGAYGFSMANRYNLQALPEERILSK